ncbi:BTAD domain-containing putative transcriptional regulator [Mycobacterium neglectum]|uniref:BTAD domain-containing putative transcriptional regulator n=1 Tax=Mycobacterium neglectum TaxID=242737 RepID=UPI000BFF10CD|nr:BTAD domain-containing putative transcriptional regulator [Mycobacterium neglectum]
MPQRGPVFGLLGPLLLSVDGIDVPIGTPKQRAVMASLVMNRNRPVAADSLINAVWGEDAPSEARASLHAYVSNLRRLLGSVGFDGRAMLEKVSPGYRLNIGELDVDLGRFTRARNEGVKAATAGRFDEASRHYSAALAQWRGEVLDDLRGFDFVAVFATAMADEKIATHIALAESEIACGRAKRITGELERLVSEHPFREPAWEQLMIAYYVSARQSDALDAYQRLKTILADELGIDPSPSLRDLHERILRQEPMEADSPAETTLARTFISLANRTAINTGEARAQLRAASGECYPVKGVATRIGRRSDNDIVLTDQRVSRHHAVIIDTGTSFVLIDARSANGVELDHNRIRGSAPIADGSHVRIGDTEFRFELAPK